MDIGDSKSIEINVEIHPRHEDEEDRWIVSGSVRIRDGIAHRVFSLSYQFPTKEKAEDYVGECIADWAQGIK